MVDLETLTFLERFRPLTQRGFWRVDLDSAAEVTVCSMCTFYYTQGICHGMVLDIFRTSVGLNANLDIKSST